MTLRNSHGAGTLRGHSAHPHFPCSFATAIPPVCGRVPVYFTRHHVSGALSESRYSRI